MFADLRFAFQYMQKAGFLMMFLIYLRLHIWSHVYVRATEDGLILEISMQRKRRC